MYKRKPIKLISLLLALCIFMTAIFGSSVHAKAAEFGELADLGQSIRTSETLYLKFKNLYNSETFSGNNANISTAVASVDSIYMYQFNVRFSENGSPVVDSITNLDSCGAGCDNICRASFGCGGNTVHCKDLGIISNQLLSYRRSSLTSSDIVVLWTNYDEYIYCHYNDNDDDGTYVHDVCNYYACVILGRPVIHIMTLPTTTSSVLRTRYMSLILAHETAHCLGACDRYNGVRPAEHAPNESYDCIVDTMPSSSDAVMNFYTNAVRGVIDPFCSQCKAYIASRITDWYDLEW